MLILFTRTIILYAFVLISFRLTGKRQLSDLQPFDLIITLLIADLASVPASDASTPLIYGIMPIMALFLIQHIISFLSLKSNKLRAIISGKPLIVVSRGVVQEKALRSSRYTLSDLLEQLRCKDIFNLCDVEYAILETNGDISVLLKGANAKPTYEDFNLPAPKTDLSYTLILDGSIQDKSLRQLGYDRIWLERQLKRSGNRTPEQVLFAFLNAGGILHIQDKERFGGEVRFLTVKEG